MPTRKGEPTREVRGHAPPEKFKVKSSEMARNGSKTVNSGVNF